MSYLNEKLMQQIIRERIEDIEKHKDEILTAFIAKYGFDPDECEIVTKNTIIESSWSIRKKRDIDNHVH